jgi:hypothetical protein
MRVLLIGSRGASLGRRCRRGRWLKEWPDKFGAIAVRKHMLTGGDIGCEGAAEPFEYVPCRLKLLKLLCGTGGGGAWAWAGAKGLFELSTS